MSEKRFLWRDVNGDLDASATIGLFSLEKDGSSHSSTFTALGGGAYKCTYTGTGTFTIKYDGVAEDTMTDMEWIGDDVLTTDDLASSAALGKIRMVGNELIMYTDGSSAPLHGGSVVDDLTTGGTTVPLSAAQGVTLKGLIDDLSNLNAALRSGTRWRTLDLGVATVAGTSAGNTPAAATEWVETSTSRVAKIRFPYEKLEGDTLARFTCDAKNTGADDTYIKLVADAAGLSPNETPIDSSDYEEKTSEYNIASLDNGLHEMTIEIKVDSGTGYFKNPVVQIRNN